MPSRSARLLLSLFVLILAAPAILAHDVTLTGTQSFASLDGSANDHDGAANGVFTVNDGNLVVNGVVNCNDDGPGGNSACAMAFAVSGDMTVNAGGALYAENRNGAGSGAAITLTVGGNLALGGNAVISSGSTSNSGNANGGAINATAGGGISIGAGSTIHSGTPGGTAGSIALSAGGVVAIDGNVVAGPSRTVAATRLTGVVLAGGGGNQRGGQISVTSTTFAEPAVLVGPAANVVSQGEAGAGSVTLDGCGVEVHGLVASVSRSTSTVVTIRSGKSAVIDGRDLGAAGVRMGRVRADSTTGTGVANRVDVFVADSAAVYGPASGLFAVTSNTGSNDPKGEGGSVRVIALGGTASASGNAVDAGGSNNGNGGGSIAIHAAGDAVLSTASLRAAGDSASNNNNRDGGTITVRSYSGNVIWTAGSGDVRPLGSSSSIPLADQGSILLTACGTVDTTGSSFPVNGTATSVHPQTATGVCSPAAPSLPAGTPPLVTCNTPPVANDAAATTNEDNTVTVVLSGTDADGDSLTFSIVSGPSNGTLGAIVPTGPTTATVDYTPNADFNGTDSFVYQANDGNGGTDTANVAVTVNAVNDPPSFLAGPTVSVGEDAGAQTYPNWASAISAGPADESGQTVTFTVTNDNPALFSVQPAVSSSGTLTFTAAADASGSANIAIVAQDDGGTANGGSDTSASQSSSIAVTAVNDAPSFNKGADQIVSEDAGPQTVAAWATGISAGPNEAGQTVSFVATNDNNALFSSQPAVSSNGTLTYTPAADANGTATVTVHAQDDGGTANGGVDTSAPQTFVITVNSVNDAPSFTSGGNVSVLEDSGAYSAAWASAISAGPADESGQAVAFSTSNDNNALFSVQPSVSATGVLTFTLAADAFGSANVSVTLSDDGGTANGGADTSAAQTFTVTVDGVNDEPGFTPGADQTSAEDAGPQTVAAWATAISAGPASESSQTITFVTANDNNALFIAQPSVAADGTLTYTAAADANGTATVTVYAQDDGGTANGGDDTSASYTFTITITAVNDTPSFTGGGDVSVVEDSAPYSAQWATAISAGPADEAGQTVTFNVSATNPSLFSSGPSISATGVLSFTLAANASGASTVTVTLSDDGGGANTSAPQNFTITVNAVNDAPSFAGGGDVTVNEDSGPYAAPWASAISAGPNESGQTVAFSVSNSNNALFAVQPSISPTGVLTFTPALNAFGSANVTVTLSDNGGTANGGVDTSAAQSFTITVTAVNDGPSAGNDAWDTFGNTEVRVDLPAGLTPHVADTTPSGSGVRDNDTDPEGDPIVITGIVGCGDAVAPFDCTLAGGAKVSMLANGSFSYTPAPGATSGSFQYTMTDVPAAGTPATSTGTVTFSIYDMIWYVNGAAAPGGNGTSNAPFNGFASLNSGSDVDSPGDTIFVHTSSVVGSIGLEAGQKLYGQGVGLAKPNNLNGNGSPVVLAAAGPNPVVTAAADVVTVLGVAGVEIAGLTLNSTAGNGIDLTSTPLGLPFGASIYSNVVSGASTEGIDVNAGAAGSAVSINNTSIVSAGNGLNVSAVGGVLVSYTNGTILSSAGSGIVMSGNVTVTGLANVTIDGNTAGDGINIAGATFDATAGGSFDTVNAGAITVGSSGNPVGGAGVTLSNVSGDLNLGALNVYGVTGVAISGSGLHTGAAGMRVASTSGAVNGTAGTGLAVSDATIAASGLNLTRVDSNGAANGIVLNNTDTAGGLSVAGAGSPNSGGVIQNTSSHGVLLTNTTSPSFAWVAIQNTAGSGVKGTAVTNFTFTDGSISASGTALGVNESNIAFNTSATFTENNLSGNVTITGNTLTNAYYHGVDIVNFSGTLADVNVSGNTVTSTASTSTSKGSGIRLVAFGSASGAASVTKATIANNVITNFPSGAGIVAHGGNANGTGPASTFGIAGSATSIVSITGNRISGQSAALRMGTNAISTTVNGKGQGNFDISNNGTMADPIANVAGSVIVNSALGLTTVTATINNNVIAANHAAGVGGPLGISAGASSTFGVTDTPDYTVTIDGNVISGVDGNGIFAAVRSSAGVMRARVKNNSVAAPLSGARSGIRVDAGTSTGNVNLCLDISGNSSAGSGGFPGIGLRKQGTNPAVNVFGVNGMAATSSPAVEAYVDSLNPAGGGTVLLSATTGFTNCSLP